MSLDEELERVLRLVKKAKFTGKAGKYASSFEIVIRYLGGLMSAYTLSKDYPPRESGRVGTRPLPYIQHFPISLLRRKPGLVSVALLHTLKTYPPNTPDVSGSTDGPNPSIHLQHAICHMSPTSKYAMAPSLVLSNISLVSFLACLSSMLTSHSTICTPSVSITLVLLQAFPPENAKVTSNHPGTILENSTHGQQRA